jgi:lipid A 3-O-deacylase
LDRARRWVPARSRQLGKNTYDANAELLSPRLALGFDQSWRYFVPRLHLGGSANLSGRTSFAYTGFEWNFPVFTNAFFEGFIGPAIHNGSLSGTPTMAGLGCPYLYHLGISSGYHFTESLSAVFTFEHLSNGKQLFGTNCGTNIVTPYSNGNQGLNNYGLRIGYSF